MKIARIGSVDNEKPVVIDGENAVDVSSLVSDWNRSELESGGYEKVAQADLSSLPRISLAGVRYGSPISRPTKVVCVGLNYVGHIAEIAADTPKEPVIFMKAPDSVVGADDDIVIPPGSVATDYEVELAIIIGKRALYLDSPKDAAAHILGYTISQDVSERHWQIERSGQWVKGKSFPTFNPIGPVIVSGDAINAHNLRLWCEVDGVMKQDSNTNDLLFGIDHIVWYLSQCMELFPGDVINTGTPFGVGLGFNPPIYLHEGQKVRSGIEGIGQMQSNCVAYKK
ncbi:MAG: fumarylacetoacetate hydrolase family protein [Candidatus Planktophila sp.]|jgi:2-keto-4-pentenoate hydratase/2-oxohepta-3-ene-1,7-dioic acid hydratase in catechol pathway|tara:strand:- start:75 stop:923 length:849 start_codon:yes stop_codon:yes gene_type:complete